MQFHKTLCSGILGALCVARADTFSRMTSPPFYAVGRLEDGSPYFFHDDQWAAAFVFVRLPSCVPPDFNLLDQADFTPALPGGPPGFLAPCSPSMATQSSRVPQTWCRYRRT